MDNAATILQEALGYLNFSSGTPDPRFLRNLNSVFASVEATRAGGGNSEPATRSVAHQLTSALDGLAGTSAAFADVEQARAVLRLVFDVFPPRYREFHRDLLFHQSDEAIWRPLMIGRVCEAVLAVGPPWKDTDRIIDGAIAKLNDYVGHRPVAVLRNQQRIEPYRHEWIRPVPLYIRDAGVGTGRYRQLVAQALDILRHTDPALLRDAYFDPELLDELAFDPRAYDFDHPVNKRPNYHFGQWDPHHIDHQGRYRRFVVQQVTLDVLSSRVENAADLPPDELLLEAAAVLAGTMLMASGTSGSGPDAHDSATTLGTLLPRIAAYRDAFYEAFIAKLTGPHRRRLRAEAAAGKQPLAGARQHLNQQLARRRASQLEHVHLAVAFARIGYPQAALRQAHVVPVASARMSTEIQCRLTTAHLAIDEGQLPRASQMLVEIEDFLQRGIECGALADPWSILGFQGQFSLFPVPENSVPDHRVEHLIELLESIVALYARLWSEAAAHKDAELAADLALRMKALTDWWDQFAPTSVESIESFGGGEAYDSAREVAQALAAFHEAGAAAGDIAFWRRHVSHFNSPKAYSLVVAALLEKPDLLAAMALLMQWLSQAGSIALEQGEYSFYVLVRQWLGQVCHDSEDVSDAESAVGNRAALVVRFFELLEANSEDFWQVPSLDVLRAAPGGGTSSAALADDDEDEDLAEEDDENLFGAAYDDVVFVDSTADGNDADMMEGGGPPATDFELDAESRRVGQRLAFLRTLASLWKRAAVGVGQATNGRIPPDVLETWLVQASQNERQLVALLETADAWHIPAPTASRDSLLEFDRRRVVKEALNEKIVATLVETADAARLLRAALPVECDRDVSDGALGLRALDDVVRAVVQTDVDALRRCWQPFLDELGTQPILYVPLSKGGDPSRLAKARALQQAVRDLVQWLPRMGLLAETCQLLEAARLTESTHPVGPGAISEYDRLFAAGYQAIVESLVDVSEVWSPSEGGVDAKDTLLVECLEQVTEALLRQWLAHSRTLRLSALERVADKKSWRSLVTFIEQYGRDLFTQPFLHLGNLRAIMSQGVDRWLARLEQQPEDDAPPLLLRDLGTKLPRAAAVKNLSLVIESVVENYAEYRDFNSTTTQSDRGDLLYTLLDFLRLRVQYDRVAWHLKPVLAAHSILVRRGRSAAAENWRRAIAQRTAELADTLQRRCAELREQYAMRLPTISDRIGERFVQPLAIDRVRSLVKPAMDEARIASRSDRPPRSTGDAPANPDADSTAFDLLEQEVGELALEPTGVGLDVPAWLIALEQEVDQQYRLGSHAGGAPETPIVQSQVPLSIEQVQRQLAGWEKQPK